MSKIIYFMRHAKAVPYSQEPDFKRELSNIGEIQSKSTVVKFLALGLPLPQIIIYSTANRTARTAAIVAQNFNNTPLLCPDPNLYNCALKAFIGALEEIPASQPIPDVILMVGHNPAIEDIFGLYAKQQAQISPATLYGFKFDIDRFEDLTPNTAATLICFLPTSS